MRVPKAVIQCPLNLYQSLEGLIAGPQNAEVLTQGARSVYQEAYKLSKARSCSSRAVQAWKGVESLILFHKS